MCAVPGPRRGRRGAGRCATARTARAVDPGRVRALRRGRGLPDGRRAGDRRARLRDRDDRAAVDVIVGPGNAYVQEAKRQVVGHGRDRRHRRAQRAGRGRRRSTPIRRSSRSTSPPRPSTATRRLLALATPERRAARRGRGRGGAAVRARRACPTRRSRSCGTASLEAAVELANAIAPEHLELAVADARGARAARALAPAACSSGRNGGAAFGDYVAGSNHVLPTGGAARFAGPLGASTFRRRRRWYRCPTGRRERLAPHVGAASRARRASPFTASRRSAAR